MKRWGSKYGIAALVLLLFFSCGNKQTGPDKYFGTYLTTGVVNGSVYVDSTGTRCALRSMKSYLVNDTTVPLHLHLKFPHGGIAMAEYPEMAFRIIILSDSLAKELNRDSCEVNGDVKLFMKATTYPTAEIDTIIQPGKTYAIPLMLWFNKASEDVLRMELFSKGHTSALLLPESAIQFKDEVKAFEIKFGVTLMADPKKTDGYTKPKYAVIPCGKVSIED